MKKRATEICRDSKGHGCRQLLPLSAFYYRKRTLETGMRVDERSSLCKVCRAELAKEKARDGSKVDRMVAVMKTRGPMTVPELAIALRIDKKAIKTVVWHGRQRGLVEICDSKKDGLQLYALRRDPFADISRKTLRGWGYAA